MSSADAIEELKACAGVQFDPEVVSALLDLLGHERPEVPDRAKGVRMPAAPPAKAPAGRRKRR
jgi:HD-GYP domain-containing protein (c-di-GMP phosphodiesterase class II)